MSGALSFGGELQRFLAFVFRAFLGRGVDDFGRLSEECL